MPTFPCLLAVFTLFGLPSAVSTLNISDTTSALVRGDDQGARGLGTTVNGSNAPRVSLGVNWKKADLTLSYYPLLTLANLYGREKLDFIQFHGASAGLSYTGQRTRFALAQSLGMGELFIANLQAPPPVVASTATGPQQPIPNTNLLPKSQILRVRSEQTTASLRHEWSQRVIHSIEGGYGISGGYGKRSELAQPRMHVASLSSALDYAANAQHNVGGTVGVSRATADSPAAPLSGAATQTQQDMSSPSNVHYLHWLVGAGATWAAAWTPNVTSGTTLGASWRHSQGNVIPVQVGVFPVASTFVAVSTISGAAVLNAQTGLSVSPQVNVLTGALQTRLTVSASLSARREKTTGTLSLDGGQSLPLDSSQSAQFVAGAVTLSQGILDWLSFVAALRGQEQIVRSFDPPRTLQWVISAGITVSAPSYSF